MDCGSQVDPSRKMMVIHLSRAFCRYKLIEAYRGHMIACFLLVLVSTFIILL